MSRIVSAILLAGALVLNDWSAAAAPDPAPIPPTKTVATARNHAALPPGRAAGIKKAQGIEGDRYWLEAGLIIGAFVIAYLLAGIDGSDEATATTGP